MSRVGTHGVLHPTTFPSDSANSRITRPMVIIEPPIQSTVLRIAGSCPTGGTGIT